MAPGRQGDGPVAPRGAGDGSEARAEGRGRLGVGHADVVQGDVARVLNGVGVGHRLAGRRDGGRVGRLVDGDGGRPRRPHRGRRGGAHRLVGVGRGASRRAGVGDGAVVHIGLGHRVGGRATVSCLWPQGDGPVGRRGAGDGSEARAEGRGRLGVGHADVVQGDVARVLNGVGVGHRLAGSRDGGRVGRLVDGDCRRPGRHTVAVEVAHTGLLELGGVPLAVPVVCDGAVVHVGLGHRVSGRATVSCLWPQGDGPVGRRDAGDGSEARAEGRGRRRRSRRRCAR